jgi:hypothetical protein
MCHGDSPFEKSKKLVHSRLVNGHLGNSQDGRSNRDRYLAGGSDLTTGPVEKRRTDCWSFGEPRLSPLSMMERVQGDVCLRNTLIGWSGSYFSLGHGAENLLLRSGELQSRRWSLRRDNGAESKPRLIFDASECELSDFKSRAYSSGSFAIDEEG